MSTAQPNQPPRSPFRERLLPLLYRRASARYYRRSPRFARHCARVGPEGTLPVPPLADALAVYLSQRLPPWFISRYGVAGVFRSAKSLAGLIGATSLIARPFFALAKLAWRGFRWLIHPPTAGPRFVRRAPVGNAAVTLGGRVLFRGFTYADNRLCCYFERTGPVHNASRIVVHLYPERPGVLSPEHVPLGRFCKDHDPAQPLPTWPCGRVYRDQISLADLPPGDYRVEAGVIDVVLRECLTSEENGRPTVDLGWVRVVGTRPEAPDPALAGAAHAGA